MSFISGNKTFMKQFRRWGQALIAANVRPQANHSVFFDARSTLIMVLITGAIGGMAVQQQVAAQEAQVRFNIPAQALPDALNEFARQSGKPLLFSDEVVRGKQGQAVNGSMTPSAALGRILSGTGIQVLTSGGGVYTLRAPDQSDRDVTTLGAVTITGSVGDLPPVYAGGQVATGSRVGILGNLDFMETPFSTVSYTEKYIDDTQAKDIGSVIGATDASVYVPQSLGIQEAFLMRGFSVNAGDITYNGLPNMAPYMRGSTEMVERVEVQKGPSAMLRGAAPSGGIGGSVNLVPKRAGDVPLTRLTATYQSDRQFGVHADVGRRFGENRQFGVRFNGVWRDGDTAVADQQQKMGLGALALDWRGERVRLSADIYRQRETLDGIDYFGIQTIGDAVTELPPALKGDRNLAAPWNFNINSTTAAMARAEWDITNSVTAYAAYGHRDASYDAVITQMSLLNDAGDITYTPIRQYMEALSRSAEIGLQGQFSTGPINHAWALSGNRTLHEYGVKNIRSTQLNRSTNFYALDYGALPEAFHDFSKSGVPTTSESEQDSVALADRMSFMDDRVQLTLGVRRQRLKSIAIDANTGVKTVSYDQSALSPSAALLVRVAPKLSVYGSYIQALNQGGSAPANAANAYEMLAPFKSKQYEVGIKYDMGGFAATASLFQITRPSAYTDPVTNIYAASGEQRNRGLELNVFGEVGRGMRLMGGMTLLDATLKNQLNGLNEGNKVTGVPRIVARMGAEYDLADVPGLALTGRLNYVGKRYATADNRLALPSYVTLDIGARYVTQVGGKAATVRASIDNVTNKAYWGGSWGGSGNSGLSGGLGAPRTFLLSATVDF